MVYYYSIRGGPCRNAHSHIALDGEQDIICYVGRDKHENEHLIKYGWPGDVWFHVEGLSSAHVYFRIKNLHSNLRIPIGGIPMDDLPTDTIYDMMQICKHNSIQGSKLASCKMVYTPHSNLKKSFEMDSGTVTYHDTKLCRYGRCDKDRPRIKQLEKSKSQDIVVDFYEEFQQHQRNMIQRRKQERNRPAMDTEIYDPMLDDLKAIKHKSHRQGDELSGLDAALDGLSFTKGTGTVDAVSGGGDEEDEYESQRISTDPIWMQEDKRRRMESDDHLIFLCERGYNLDQAKQALEQHGSRIDALKALFYPPDVVNSPIDDSLSGEDRKAARQEEKEVLQAIFGEDDPHVSFQEDDDDNLDSTFPITSYEPPKRYELPPPLLMEVYASCTKYPSEPPVLAVKGGGLCEDLLNRLTKLLQTEVLTRASEEPGDPQIFNLLQFVGEQVEVLVEEEQVELEKKERERRAQQAQAAREAASKKSKQEGPSKTIFHSDGERRAYAKSIVAAGSASLTSDPLQKATKKEEKQHYNTGVSDKSLIEDLFG